MRHKKIKKEYLRYAVLDKTTMKVGIYHYKTQVSNLIGVSTRTLDRAIPYENDKFAVYLIANVVL